MWIYYIMFSSQSQMENWRSDLKEHENIFTQEINSMNLVTLDKLCKYLDIHYNPNSNPASGSFNDTYFTHFNNDPNKKLAIRVSQEPVAYYNRGQKLLQFTGVGVSEEETVQRKKEQKDYKPSDRERAQPKEKKGFIIEKMPDYSLHTKEIQDAEFLTQLDRSKTNWLKSSHKGLCPPIIYYGYIIDMKRIGISGYIVEIRSCIISQKYSMDLKGFYKLKTSQAIDMFPQTYHVENVVLLEKI